MEGWGIDAGLHQLVSVKAAARHYKGSYNGTAAWREFWDGVFFAYLMAHPSNVEKLLAHNDDHRSAAPEHPPRKRWPVHSVSRLSHDFCLWRCVEQLQEAAFRAAATCVLQCVDSGQSEAVPGWCQWHGLSSATLVRLLSLDYFTRGADAVLRSWLWRAGGEDVTVRAFDLAVEVAGIDVALRSAVRTKACPAYLRNSLMPREAARKIQSLMRAQLSRGLQDQRRVEQVAKRYCLRRP
eukprot:UN0013